MRSFICRLMLGTTTAIIALVGMILLPHDRYIRFQDMQVEAYARLGWIYERIHFDPTRIDIAFIGTSHTLNGVDAAGVADAIKEAAKISGHDIKAVHVVNFAFPAYGRSMHWLLARELLENRKVGTLVLEVVENETRKPHPLFVYPAEVSDVIQAPLFVNLNYFHDVVRLPFRQLSLFIKSIWPGQFGLKARFDPAHYDGETVDNTRVVQVNGKALGPIRNQRMDPAKLNEAAEARSKAKNLHMLGRYFGDLEYRLPRYYVRQILNLAERKHVPLKFLYLPAYGQPDRPYDTSLYDGRGDIVAVNDILNKPQNWKDIDHLNLGGAMELSARLGSILIRDIGRAQELSHLHERDD